MQGVADDSIRFDLLGPLRARRGQQELDLGPGKQRAVLATLLLVANRAVPPGQIIDIVWGTEPPANGANVVQKYVAGLRRVLEPDRAPRSGGELLTLTDGGYRLSVAPGNTDLDVFTNHVGQARQYRSLGRLDEASSELRAALSLWRAEPLAGLTGSYFETARAHLANDRASALEDWAEVELELGNQLTLLPELARLVAEYPLRERLRGVQMLALYRTGRQAEALSVFRDTRRVLVDAHGVEPGPDLQSLHNRMLQNDPALNNRPQPIQDAPAPTPEWTPAPAMAPPAIPPPPTAPPAVVEPLTWKTWLLKFGVALVPIATFSLAAGPLMGIVAIRRRSIRLGIIATIYLAGTVAGFTMIDTSSDEVTGTKDGLGLFLVIGTALVCAIHAAVIIPRRTSSPNPELDARRQYARQIAADHPQIARQLGIGRPDLPNQIDDGGLVDINDAPEPVLRTLPGVTAQQAALIVADRTYRGRFHSFQDLAARGLFPWPIPEQIADVVLIISVQDVTEEDHQ